MPAIVQIPVSRYNVVHNKKKNIQNNEVEKT